MTERAFRFGAGNHLVGIVGQAEEPAPTGIILVNTGMVHRVGPFRLHVELARRLNACGYPALRFDLSTLGDSTASGRSLSRTEQNHADMDDAMDLLARQAGCSRFVLFGLCSGATVAHQAALHSTQPVAGAVFIDGYTYRSLGFRLRYYLPLLGNARRVLQYVARMGRHLRQQRAPAFAFAQPPRSQVRADYLHMLEQDLELCFLFSGGIGYYFNHPRQFQETFGRRVARHPNVTMHYLAHTDHTYSLLGDREQLVDTIATWLQERVPPHGCRTDSTQ